MERKCQVQAVASALLSLVLAGVLAGSGCSSQDFARPVGRITDVLDSGRPYVASDDEEVARQRAERLARVLMAWDRQQEDRRRDYHVGPEDVLDIGILALEEPGKVSRLQRRIGKDGLITLPFVGDVPVAGRTTREVEQTIAAAYAGKYLKNPQVTVTVAQYRSAPVVVTGMVNKPAVYYLRENESSVLEILSEAGGLHPNAGDVLHIIRAPTPGGSVSTESDGTIAKASSVTVCPPGVAVPPNGVSGESQPAEFEVPVQGSTGTEAVGGEADKGSASELTPTSRPRRRGWFQRPRPESPRGAPALRRTQGEEVTNQVASEGRAGREEDNPSPDRLADAEGERISLSASESRPGKTTRQEGADIASMEPRQSAGGPSLEGNEEIPEPAALVPEVLTVDLKRLLDEGDIRLNLPVRGGDLISVPPAKRRYVYVLGYVRAPGQYELRDQPEISALHAVALAGGLAPAARAENSLLIRETPSGRKITSVDLTKIVRGVRPTLYLQPGDTLIVGSGFFARLAEFIKPTAAVGASATLNPVP